MSEVSIPYRARIATAFAGLRVSKAGRVKASFTIMRLEDIIRLVKVTSAAIAAGRGNRTHSEFRDLHSVLGRTEKMWKRNWVILLACLCAGASIPAAEAPKGYVTARKLAEQLKLEYRLLSAGNPEGKVAACRLSDAKYSVMLYPGLTRAFVNREMVPFGGEIKVGEGDLLVPKAAVARMALAMERRLPVARRRSRGRKVVIDPGHGGKDPGAISRWGLKEKDVNLAVSKRLAALLRERGVKVVMTRTTDSYPDLDDRVRLANREKPDAFISVHTNALDLKRNRNGARISGFLTLYPQDGPAVGRSLVTVTGRAKAKRAPRLDPVKVGAGHALSEHAKKAIRGALLEEYRIQSLELARSIQKGLGQTAATRDLGAREDDRGLRVLRWVLAPAVLVEVDFLSNRKAERRLRDPRFRQKLAEGIADGIVRFLATLDQSEDFTR